MTIPTDFPWQVVAGLSAALLAAVVTALIRVRGPSISVRFSAALAGWILLGLIVVAATALAWLGKEIPLIFYAIVPGVIVMLGFKIAGKGEATSASEATAHESPYSRGA